MGGVFILGDGGVSLTIFHYFLDFHSRGWGCCHSRGWDVFPWRLFTIFTIFTLGDGGVFLTTYHYFHYFHYFHSRGWGVFPWRLFTIFTIFTWRERWWIGWDLFTSIFTIFTLVQFKEWKLTNLRQFWPNKWQGATNHSNAVLSAFRTRFPRVNFFEFGEIQHGGFIVCRKILSGDL